MTGGEDITEPARRFWQDVWSRGELDVLDEIATVDFVENGKPVGVAEFKQGVAGWRALFEGFTATIEEILTVGDRVVTRVSYSGRHVAPWGPLPGTGAEISGLGIDIFRIRDGRIAELWHSADHLPLVRQMGGRVVAISEE